MYLTSRKYIEPDHKVAELVLENPSFLLVLEHFGVDEVFKDKTVEELCRLSDISVPVFTAICNLYNGFNFTAQNSLKRSDIPVVIRFLSNSHRYYVNEKYPEILNFIRNLSAEGNKKEIELIEVFFNEYFIEVREHLEYEEEVVFPYFNSLAGTQRPVPGKEFSASYYLDHHSDIESKLADLKNLLLNHLHIKNLNSAKRKLLFALFELEYDLTAHSVIEEQILIPLGISAETEKH
ncbi:MAG TPA: hemerythrin domain-containing protein [Bacteroidales bacterium]|nr:hemerythrin domain-containing protein [Bacteroidales bacterium]